MEAAAGEVIGGQEACELGTCVLYSKHSRCLLGFEYKTQAPAG